MRTLLKPGHQVPEFADRELQQHRRIVVLEADLHQLRQRVQPRNAVVDLEHRLAARLQDAVALVDEALRVGGVLHDAVREDEIEGVVGKRKRLAVGDAQVGIEPLLLEVCLRQVDGRCGEIDAGAHGAALREPREIDGRAAADLEDRLAAVSIEVDETQQVMELLEVILIEIVEEPARPHRMAGDFEIVDMLFPVPANFVDGRHAGYYIVSSRGPC